MPIDAFDGSKILKCNDAQSPGGPDGGRDLEAIFETGLRAWVAVGFQNSVSDSPAEKKQAAKKFKSDLQRMLKEPEKPDVFVFFTNVSLTPGEKKLLVQFAKGKGFTFSEIFDREQLRIWLDTPEGLAARYRYLEMELSPAEQQAFFSRWGEDIQSLIVNSQTTIENRLRRLEFQVDGILPLRSMSFHLFLNSPLSESGIEHFRIPWRLFFLPWRNRPSKPLCFQILACDSQRNRKGEVIQTSDSLSHASWIAKKSFDNEGSSILNRSGKQIAVWEGGDSIMDRGLLDAALGDLDGAAFVINVNKKLAPLISGIVITANNYCVAAIPKDLIRVSDQVVSETLPFRFSTEELSDPWVRVGTDSAPSYFNFSGHTPERLFSPTIIDPSAVVK